MNRSSAALMLLVAAVISVVVGTTLREAAEKNRTALTASLTRERADIVRLEGQRASIASRPSPFRGCSDTKPQQPVVTCYECLGISTSVTIAVDTDADELLGEIDGRRWECRSVAAIERAIANDRQDLAAYEIDLAEHERRLRRGTVLIFAGFVVAFAALARAFARR